MYTLCNKVLLIGYLGNYPEIKVIAGEKKFVRFSMATNENYNNAKGEKVTETQWHQVVGWGNPAEIAEKFLKKGSHIAIQGKLINRNYIDKEGNKKNISEIQLEELVLLDEKAANNEYK